METPSSSEGSELLLSLLDPDFRRRTDAMRRAQNLDNTRRALLISALQFTLNHPRPDVRAAALHTLGALDRNRQTLLLIHHARRDPAWQVRSTAVRELGRLERDAPRAELLAALKDLDFTVRDTAIWALKPLAIWAWEEQHDKQPLNALACMLRDENELVRAAAAEVAGSLAPYIPSDTLRQLLQHDESELVRAAVAEALGQRRKSDN